jgi:ADP-ribosylglycohydrolase
LPTESSDTDTELFRRIHGCIAGGAIGDAMGGATEMMHYSTIEQTFGEITGLVDYGATRETARFSPGQPAGAFTDDSRLRHLFCDAIVAHGGRIAPDDLADTFRSKLTGWYFVPVVNTYYKLMNGVRPRDAGRGNMGSNSTAMSIAPVGIMNACDPWQAAQDAYALAGLVHEGYSRDAAAIIAAAVAAAFIPGLDARQVIDAALASVDRDSELVRLVEQALDLASASGVYTEFRARFYDSMLVDWPQTDIVDGTLAPPGFYDTAEPRETIPACLALFVLADGDPARAILHAANFGRDADTMGAIIGSVAGAFGGIQRIPNAWVEQVAAANETNLETISLGVYGALLRSIESQEQTVKTLRDLAVVDTP